MRVDGSGMARASNRGSPVISSVFPSISIWSLCILWCVDVSIIRHVQRYLPLLGSAKGALPSHGCGGTITCTAHILNNLAL